jgi:DNA-binding MarR family transcriptional regulator
VSRDRRDGPERDGPEQDGPEQDGTEQDDGPQRQDVRLANEAWESLFRAQAVLARRFSADDVWQEVSPSEYDVLYTLATHHDRHRDHGRGPGGEVEGPGEGLTMVQINREVLLTQGGISRLIARLVERGLLRRHDDPRDRRAARVVLTARGRAVQRAVGRRHARAVSAAMTAALTREQMQELRDLTRRLAGGPARDPVDGPPAG